MYVKADSVWLVSDTSEASQISSSRSSSKVDSTTSTKYVEQTILLADGATDQAVDLGDVSTGKALRIEASRAISAKINAASVGIPIGHTATASASLQIDATDITSLSLSNASGDTATVKISIPGV